MAHATLDAFRYMLRSGMMGWFTLMTDSSRWTAEQARRAPEFDLYKRELRPLIRGRPVPRERTPDGVHWDGIEYYSRPRARGVLYAFRGSTPDEAAHTFRLKGLQPQARYRIHFRDKGPAANRTLGGEELMDTGLTVSLEAPVSSELVFFRQVPSGGRRAAILP